MCWNFLSEIPDPITPIPKTVVNKGYFETGDFFFGNVTFAVHFFPGLVGPFGPPSAPPEVDVDDDEEEEDDDDDPLVDDDVDVQAEFPTEDQHIPSSNVQQPIDAHLDLP